MDADAVNRIQHNLLAEDPVIRRAVLQINATVATSQEEARLWSLCLNVESTDLSLERVRDRAANIKRLGIFIQENVNSERPLSEAELRGALMYLCSQLKVNFRPLYSETAVALSQVASTHGDLLWNIIWPQLIRTQSVRQLEHTSTDHAATMIMNDVSADDMTGKKAEVCNEEDPSMRCTSLHRFQATSSQVWKSETPQPLSRAKSLVSIC